MAPLPTVSVLAAFNAVALPSFKVPPVTVTDPIKAGLELLSANCEVELFSVTFVTAAPSTPVMVVVPDVPPLFVMLPALLMDAALNVTVLLPRTRKCDAPVIGNRCAAEREIAA